MQLAIDAGANRLTIDGRGVAGHHRWEAAAIAVLVDGGHRSAESACPAAALQSALQSLGQLRPLNRKQISRLWEGAAQMFDAAGAADAFRQRFGHPVRGLTVGPWWWAPRPGDRVRVAPDVHAGANHELPQLTASGSAIELARLCQHAMLCHAMVLDGRFDDAEVALLDDEAWRHASPEALAFRQLSLADLYQQRRRFSDARRALDAASRTLKRSAVADVHLGGTARYLEHRLAYARAPVRNHGRILAAVAPVLGRAPGVWYPELDRHARGLTLNLAALCERRQFEQLARRRGGPAARPHLASALRYWSAALYGFITAHEYESAQNVCSNVAYTLQRGFELRAEPQPDAALEWYAVAQVLQNRFMLADNNVWEYIFLGDFWLYAPPVRPAFEAMAARVQWAGKRPDRIDFYEAALERARELGDPRQRAHTALNLWHFARQQRSTAPAAAARREFDAVITAHPDVAEILRAEGYPLP